MQSLRSCGEKAETLETGRREKNRHGNRRAGDGRRTGEERNGSRNGEEQSGGHSGQGPGTPSKCTKTMPWNCASIQISFNLLQLALTYGIISMLIG